MEIIIVITTVVVITTILIMLLNKNNKKIDASSPKKVNTQKLSDKSIIGKTDELLNLKKLLDEKVISQEEFEKAKEELLNFNNQKLYDDISETTSALIESEISLFKGFFVSLVLIVISLLFYYFYI